MTNVLRGVYHERKFTKKTEMQKMEKTKWLAVLMVGGILSFLGSCKATITPGGGTGGSGGTITSYKAGDTALANIIINEIT